MRGADGGTEFLPAAAAGPAETVELAARRLTALTGRLVTRAVVVVPDEADARLALYQAVEAGGLDVLRLIDAAEALALAPEPAVMGCSVAGGGDVGLAGYLR